MEVSLPFQWKFKVSELYTDIKAEQIFGIKLLKLKE